MAEGISWKRSFLNQALMDCETKQLRALRCSITFLVNIGTKKCYFTIPSAFHIFLSLL